MKRPVLQHSRLQKPPDDAQQVRISHPMRHEPHQMLVINRIEEALDIGFHHPLRALPGDNLVHTRKRLVCAAARPKPVGAFPKLRLPDRLQNATYPILHDPVLEAR
jgi:hypothetical protein